MIYIYLSCLRMFRGKLHKLGTFIKYYKISQLIHTQIIAN